jgi:hypothetical protein
MVGEPVAYVQGLPKGHRGRLVRFTTPRSRRESRGPESGGAPLSLPKGRETMPMGSQHLLSGISGIFATVLAIAGIYGLLQLVYPSTETSRPNSSLIVDESQAPRQGNSPLPVIDRSYEVQQRALTMPPPSRASGGASVNQDNGSLPRSESCIGSTCPESNNRAITGVDGPNPATSKASRGTVRSSDAEPSQRASPKTVAVETKPAQPMFVHTSEGSTGAATATERSKPVSILETPNKGE